MSHTILIAGAGGIGSAVALLVTSARERSIDVILADGDGGVAEEAAAVIASATGRPDGVRAIEIPTVGLSEELIAAAASSDLLLDCLPGSQAPRMARLALEQDCHYVNLTEYVAETQQIVDLAKGVKRGFALQTGLAPGFVNVLGHALFQRFRREHRVNAVDTLIMRVGALPQVVVPPHFYGWTWSPVGVATEYVEPSVVVRDHEVVSLSSLGERGRFSLGGVVYEEALTSGGGADLPWTLHEHVRNLDYKTLRHPGHYAWVDEHLARPTLAGADRATRLQEAMEADIPYVQADEVIVYVAVEGPDHRGLRRRIEAGYRVRPMVVAGRRLRAIQATTAAGMAQMAELLIEGHASGVVLSRDVDAEAYLSGSFVSRVYEPGRIC